LALAEESHDERETYSHFSGGDGDDEENETRSIHRIIEA
jgi:hypothetical protein